MKKDAVVFMLMQATYEKDIGNMRSRILSVVEMLSTTRTDKDSAVRERIISLVRDSGGMTKKKLISTAAGIESASKTKVSEILSLMVADGSIKIDSNRKIGSNRAIVYVLGSVDDSSKPEIRKDSKLPPDEHLARARMVRGIIIEIMKNTTDKKAVIEAAIKESGVPHDVVLKQYKNVTEYNLTQFD